MSEGNNIPRTKNVSIMIPTATINPKMNKSEIGVVIKAANVAASIIPAEEITPPVFRIAISNASFTL